MDKEDSRKKSPEGEELSAEELETITGALYIAPVGGGSTGGTTHTVGDVPENCKASCDTGILGCPG
jgi:hypothetical protein